MSEIINTFLLSDPEVSMPMDRAAFYAEQIESFQKTGQVTRAVEIIAVFIFNRAGELLIQKRSYEKKHNPGLLDKSVGGHVRYGDTADFSVMVETVQELQTPSIVLKNDTDFKKTIGLLAPYMATVAIIRHIKTNFYIFEKIFQGTPIKIANKIHVYFGIYDGSTRIVDREAKGTLFYTLNELDNEIKQFSRAFTPEMSLFLQELRPDMEQFLENLLDMRKAL